MSSCFLIKKMKNGIVSVRAWFLSKTIHPSFFIFVEFHRHLKGKEISLWQINIDVGVEVGDGSILISQPRRSSVSSGIAASRAWSNIPRVISLVRAIHFNEWKPDQLIRERAVEKARGNENAATSAERSIQPAVRQNFQAIRKNAIFLGFPRRRCARLREKCER